MLICGVFMRLFQAKNRSKIFGKPGATTFKRLNLEKNMIYLAQTDTTAGFLSKDFREINALKRRAADKPCLITTAKLSELKNLARVPAKFKNLVRRTRKTTFLYPNAKAVRVVKDCAHEEFLRKFDWLYSSSANLNGQSFDEAWARAVADEVVDQNFSQNAGSKIYKISKTNLKRIR